MRSALVAAGISLLVVGVVLDRSGWWGWSQELTDAPVLAVALAGLVGGGLLTRLDGPPARRTGAVVAAAAGVAAAVVLVTAIVDGLPGPATGVLLVGVAAVTVGAVARGGRPRVGRRGPVARVGTAVGVVVAAVLGGTVVDLPRRTLADGPAPDAPVVTRGALVRWTWSAGGPIADVVPVRGGVAVLRGTDGPRSDDLADSTDRSDEPGDEIVAVDGTTGAARWTFRRGEQRVDALTPSPDGHVLAVSWALPHGATLVDVLDAASGATRFSVTLSERPGVLQLTDRVLTTLEPRPAPPSGSSGSSGSDTTYGLVARSLGDGATAWTWAPPADCRLEAPWFPTLGPPGRWTLATTGVGVTPIDCGADRVLVGLDDRSGTARWTTPGGPRVTPEGRTVSARPDVTSLPDGSAVLVGGDPARVVDVATGASRPVPGLGEFDLGAVRPGPVRALALTDGLPTGSIDARTGALAGLPPESPGECSTSQGAVLVTDTTTLRLCGVGTGFGLRADDGPVLPVDLGPPALVDLDLRSDGLLYRRSEYLLVPAPGALVLGTTRSDPAILVGVA